MHLRQYFILAILLMATFPLVAQTDSVATFIAAKETQGLRLSVLAQRADGTVFFAHNPDRQVPSASVIKIPILLELLYQVQAKRLKLSDMHTLKEADKVGGSGDLQAEAAGRKFSIDALAAAMIATSDNTATNILIEKIGQENVNRMLAYHGFQVTQLQRKMMDFEAIKQGKQNYTSAREMNRLLHLLLTKQLLKPRYAKKMIDYLLRCQDVSTIPRHLPKTIPIAHKTGTLDYLRGDAAIIYADSPIVVSIFVENFESLEQAEKIIGKIAQLLVAN